MISLSVSIVLYKSSKNDVIAIIDNLLKSDYIYHIYIVDNSPYKTDFEEFTSSRVTYIKSEINLGYGAGHNLAIKKILTTSDYHLVINPDIKFSLDSIHEMIFRISADNNIGLISPRINSFEGDFQYSFKLIPAPITLFLRRFLPFISRMYPQINHAYELRFAGQDREIYVPVVSGCFMFFRVSALTEIGLFDDRFFMYMEDIDICRRIRTKFKILYFPSVSIYHKHARESYKSFSMLFIHTLSAIKYFNKWGWIFDKEKKNLNHITWNQIKNQCSNNITKLNNCADVDFLDTKISIITSCYNSADTIIDTLNSLATQNFKNFEHIIIDGGSTDRTLDILKEWKKFPLKIFSEKDDGIYDAMNKGLRIASGDIIGILNSDDFYENSNVLSKVVATMQTYNVDCVYSDLLYVDKFDTNKIVRSWQSCAYETGMFESGWQPPHPTFFVRRTVYEKYGFFDLNFDISADFELMLRFLHKYKISSIYIPAVQVKMRYGGESNKNIRNIIKANLNSLNALEKNGIKLNRFIYIFKRLFPKILNRFHHFLRIKQ